MAIGTTALLLGAAAIGGVASLAGGAIQANAATSAANVQTEYNDKALNIQQEGQDKALALQQEGLDFQKSQAEQARADQMPWLVSGEQALFKYYDELGISRPETSAFTGENIAMTEGKDFTATPGYEFQVAEGEKSVLNNLAALGLKGSGAALKRLTTFGQQMANTEYNNYLDRLAGAASAGQTASTNAASTALSTGSSVSNSLSGMADTILSSSSQIADTTKDAGAIRGSAYVGSANAWSNALSNVSNTLGTASGYLNGRAPVALM